MADEEREFDLRWADGAEHKEPSARARMLAAKWKDQPPEAVPFRGEPTRRRRRLRMPVVRRGPWTSVAVVFGSIAVAILALGYSGFQGF